jgi:esterase/lipase
MRAKSVMMRIYPRSAHVVACDTDREEVARDLVSFVGKLQTPVEP